MSKRKGPEQQGYEQIETNPDTPPNSFARMLSVLRGSGGRIEAIASLFSAVDLLASLSYLYFRGLVPVSVLAATGASVSNLIFKQVTADTVRIWFKEFKSTDVASKVRMFLGAGVLTTFLGLIAGAEFKVTHDVFAELVKQSPEWLNVLIALGLTFGDDLLFAYADIEREVGGDSDITSRIGEALGKHFPGLIYKFLAMSGGIAIMQNWAEISKFLNVERWGPEIAKYSILGILVAVVLYILAEHPKEVGESVQEITERLTNFSLRAAIGVLSVFLAASIGVFNGLRNIQFELNLPQLASRDRQLEDRARDNALPDAGDSENNARGAGDETIAENSVIERIEEGPLSGQYQMVLELPTEDDDQDSKQMLIIGAQGIVTFLRNIRTRGKVEVETLGHFLQFLEQHEKCKFVDNESSDVTVELSLSNVQELNRYWQKYQEQNTTN